MYRDLSHTKKKLKLRATGVDSSGPHLTELDPQGTICMRKGSWWEGKDTPLFGQQKLSYQAFREQPRAHSEQLSGEAGGGEEWYHPLPPASNEEVSIVWERGH